MGNTVESWRHTLGQNIASERIKLGWDQADLASKFGVQRTAVSKWETGRTNFDVNVLFKLCNLFGKTPSELMGEDWLNPTDGSPPPNGSKATGAPPSVAVARSELTLVPSNGNGPPTASSSDVDIGQNAESPPLVDKEKDVGKEIEKIKQEVVNNFLNTMKRLEKLES